MNRQEEQLTLWEYIYPKKNINNIHDQVEYVIEKYPYEIISQIKDSYENSKKVDGGFGVLNTAAQLHSKGEKGAYKYALKYLKDEPIPIDDLQIIIPTLVNIMLLDPRYGKYVTKYLKKNMDILKFKGNTVIESVKKNAPEAETVKE